MLIVLVVLVLILLLVPVDVAQGAIPTFDQMADYRMSLLTLIVTVFGAWVGAGAAYFFGRENLKEAADSMLATSHLSLWSIRYKS